MSFSAGIRVMLASGAAVPISRLRPGENILATNVKTGKTQAEPITAVLVHHDTDRYDLKIRDHGRTAVIDTTSSHLFWVPVTHRWVKAAALRHGTRLRNPGGNDATVVGGYVRRQHDGWMWDLAVARDHDFYIDPELSDFRFQVEYRTNDFNTQMGLERILYDRYPEAQAANGGFNYHAPVVETHLMYNTYMQAAQDYLAALEGGG